jgi:hypothetical protein
MSRAKSRNWCTCSTFFCLLSGRMSAVGDMVRELLKARTGTLDFVRFEDALAHVAARRQLYMLLRDVQVDGETVRPLYILACTHAWRPMYSVVHAASKCRFDLVAPMADGVSPAAALLCAVRAKMYTYQRHDKVHGQSHLELLLEYLEHKTAGLTEAQQAWAARHLAAHRLDLDARDIRVLTGALQHSSS